MKTCVICNFQVLSYRYINILICLHSFAEISQDVTLEINAYMFIPLANMIRDVLNKIALLLTPLDDRRFLRWLYRFRSPFRLPFHANTIPIATIRHARFCIRSHVIMGVVARIPAVDSPTRLKSIEICRPRPSSNGKPQESLEISSTLACKSYASFLMDINGKNMNPESNIFWMAYQFNNSFA